MTEEKFTFGDALDTLKGIIGYKTPGIYFVGKFTAERLGIDAPNFAKKRSGRAPVNEMELSKIIDLYRLGEYGLDFRLFQVTSKDEFLNLLREKGVGTYGQHISKTFRQFLYNRSLEASSNKVRIFDVAEPSRRGGVGFGDHDRPNVLELKLGSSVRVICEGKAGQYVILLNERIDHEITVLVPSLFSPDMISDEKTVIFPNHVDCEKFEVFGPSGDYRMFAIWTTQEIASLVRSKIDISMKRPPLFPDELAASLHPLLAGLRNGPDIAACEYTVTDF